MKVIGIDYSLISPSVSIFTYGIKTFLHSTHYYLTNTNKFVGVVGDNILGMLHKPYNSDIQRYENIANWVLACANPTKDDVVYLEGYSMGSKGKIFNIAENTCVLKYLLHKNEIRYIIVPPTVIKQYATGKGNSDKQKMFDAFLEKTGIDLKKKFGITTKLTNPITDIIDSYFIGCYGVDYERNGNN